MQDKQSAAFYWAPACAGATDIWFCKSLKPSETFQTACLASINLKPISCNMHAYDAAATP